MSLSLLTVHAACIRINARRTAGCGYRARLSGPFDHPSNRLRVIPTAKSQNPSAWAESFAHPRQNSMAALPTQREGALRMQAVRSASASILWISEGCSEGEQHLS